MIAVAAAAAYLASALFGARWLYGRLRAHSIDCNRREFPALYPDSRALAEWNKVDRPMVMFTACALALIWPLTLLGAAVGRPLAAFLNGAPARSQFEIAAERAERDRRIAELEAENDRLRRSQP